MMALLDVLQARTKRRHRTAQVSCGELGLLSVEALPPAELERPAVRLSRQRRPG